VAVDLLPSKQKHITIISDGTLCACVRECACVWVCVGVWVGVWVGGRGCVWGRGREDRGTLTRERGINERIERH